MFILDKPRMRSTITVVESKQRKESSGSCFRRTLPPPPDIRRVQYKHDSAANTVASDSDETPDQFEVENIPPEIQHQLSIQEGMAQEELSTGMVMTQQPPIKLFNTDMQQMMQISPMNTTLIGDKYAACFQNPDSKWLVQLFPRSVLQTITNRIVSGEIDVSKRYIFLMVGGNQVFRAVKTIIANELKMLSQCIIGRNPVAKIFVAGVLPRPSKLHAKFYITRFNRFLAAGVKKIQKDNTRIFYIPVQLQFHAQHEYNYLFDSDMLTLNVFGRMRLKRALLKGAGFIANS